MDLISKKDLLCLEGISCLAFNKDFSSKIKLKNKKIKIVKKF